MNRVQPQMCAFCDKHAATNSGKYPDMCEYCHQEFQAVMQATRVRCETCPTPFSCMIAKKCSNPEISNADQNDLFAIPSNN